MAAPHRPPSETLRLMLKLRRNGLQWKEIALHFNVHRRTILRWRQYYQELS